MQSTLHRNGADIGKEVSELTARHTYLRPVHYYETDQMGIVHHSNYIRWFEEARLDLMAAFDIRYQAMEEQGILIPVVDAACKYLIPAKYGDTVCITLTVTAYTAVRICFQYEVRRAGDDALLATGSSTHCFVNSALHPISLKQQLPAVHEIFASIAAEE